MLKILLVDDHPVIRYAVRMLIEHSGHTVVAETENGADALRLTRELQPDIILLDMGLPKIDGFQVIEHLRKQTRSPKILVLTSQASAHFALRCQKAGANGFITKTEELSGLIEAINVVGRGYTYYPQPDYMENWRDDGSNALQDSMVIAQLSDREMSVLTGLAGGLSNKEISIRLALSEKTISTYKHRLKMKLNASTIIDLIDFARRNQLIE